MTHIYTRAFNPETDSGFIYATFPKGVYFGSPNKKRLGTFHEFSESFKPYLKEQFEYSQIVIACMSNDPMIMVGYAIIDYNSVLQWVFVKPMFRRLKIGTLLIKGLTLKGVNQIIISKRGQEILAHMKEKNLNDDKPTDKPGADEQRAN